MVTSSLATLSTLHPSANTALQGEDLYDSETMVNKQIFRALGKLPTIAACAYRHKIGRPYNSPSENLPYTENFLYMLDRLSEANYVPHPKLARALDVIFILHADHELNCSTAAMRQMASTGIDPFICLSGAAAALYGPSHGGANEAALRMLEEIGKVENIPSFIEQVKAKKRRLMGFGHRIYKSYDPRAKILKQMSEEVFSVMGRSDLIDVAMELERIALSDEYFIKRNLYPNVDFYSGIIYKMMGFPTDFFPVLFCIARTSGWLAHWKEQLKEKTPIFRPRQIYNGIEHRKYVPMHERKETKEPLHPKKTRKDL
jgi:citrate synthase